MATVKATLTISSTDITSDVMDVTATESLTLTQGGIMRYSVTGTATGTAYTLYTANDQTGPVYMYLKNTDTTGTDYLNVFLDSSDLKTIVKLKGGEFAWLTIADAQTYKVFATTAETIIEYGIFA
jgi:hypothetical protein